MRNAISLERTTDVGVIKSIFMHPNIKDEIMDKDEEILIHPTVYWLAAFKEKTLAGLLVFFPIYGVAWNPHIAILPEHRGIGTQVMRLGVKWMFDNTPCGKILAFPFKPIMKRVYEKCGFTAEGFTTKLLSIRGELIDCSIVGLNK